MGKKTKRPSLSLNSEDNGGKIIVKIDKNDIPYYTWREIKSREKVTVLTPLKTRIWPASSSKGEYYDLFKVHEPGEPGWPKGGVTLFEYSTKGYRFFELEEVKIHPNEFKRSNKKLAPEAVPLKKRKSYYKPKGKKSSSKTNK